MVLGQVATDAKSNEITAIPLLLALLDLADCTVTIDAAGCQTAIAAHIVHQGGDYVLALNGNQPQVHGDVTTLCADARAARQPAYGMTQAETVELGHGRLETRRAFIMSDPDTIAYRNDRQRWTPLRSVALIERERTINGGTVLHTDTPS